jgi:flavin-dependent dehydrogenase
MGDLHSRWRYMVNDRKPATRNYFPLGDTLVRTNPLYGRGCSFAAVSAETLRRTLDDVAGPDEQQIAYHAGLQEELRPYYVNQRRQDRSAIKRARNALTPAYRAGWRARMLESFFEDGVRIAIRSDVGLLRQAMRGFHMLEHPDKWLGKPGNFIKVLYYWSRGKKRNAAAYPPSPGPDRNEMLRNLAIDEQADIARLGERSAVAA